MKIYKWLRWMSVNLLKELKAGEISDKLTQKFRVRLVDGTTVSEPGSTGTDWRIHYCFQLNNFICDSFKLTTPKIGESFKQFDIAEGDLLIGDRVYCTRQGIKHILNHGGHVLVRFHSTNVPLFTYHDKSFHVLEKLRFLSDGVPDDWDVWFRDPDDGSLVKARLCSLRKSKEAIELAKKKIRQEASRKGRETKDETLEYAEYVTVLTTVNRHALNAKDILELYRGRWQIELLFKRLKSIVGVGHLPKKSQESCISWLYGKILVSLLVERLYREADFFSPWGYPI
jgi:IS4 transposase